MKILLRDQKTKLYYAGEKGWKSQPEEAVSFPSSLKAWKIIMDASESGDFELVYSLENSAETFFVPIEAPLRQARS